MEVSEAIFFISIRAESLLGLTAHTAPRTARSSENIQWIRERRAANRIVFYSETLNV